MCRHDLGAEFTSRIFRLTIAGTPCANGASAEEVEAGRRLLQGEATVKRGQLSDLGCVSEPSSRGEGYLRQRLWHARAYSERALVRAAFREQRVHRVSPCLLLLRLRAKVMLH